MNIILTFYIILSCVWLIYWKGTLFALVVYFPFISFFLSYFLHLLKTLHLSSLVSDVKPCHGNPSSWCQTMPWESFVVMSNHALGILHLDVKPCHGNPSLWCQTMPWVPSSWCQTMPWESFVLMSNHALGIPHLDVTPCPGILHDLFDVTALLDSPQMLIAEEEKIIVEEVKGNQTVVEEK